MFKLLRCWVLADEMLHLFETSQIRNWLKDCILSRLLYDANVKGGLSAGTWREMRAVV